MDLGNILAFLVFPYLTLTIFTVGHLSRYLTDRYRWNAQSSEFLEKRKLFLGTTIFHWGILLTLFGHAGGLLIPQRIFDVFGIDATAHTAIAHYSGLVIGVAVVVGLGFLLARRISVPRIQATTSRNDYLTLAGLIFVGGTGLYNVLFGHHDVLVTVAPWIRGIVTFSPEPGLMRDVPLSYQVHVLGALTLLAFSPFSRLVHIWSVPLSYFFRSWLVFRRRVVE
ncbi:MAG: NarI [uncultured bacterium]|nr:MAG: NarI [uncultured bacterium]HBG21388.1 respiratory nitrate reductase subunit gamma [Desulfobulbaceae bacterium]